MNLYNTYTLGNGLRIIHLPTSSHVVYCGYEINVGSRNEQIQQWGLAHFCEHATFKGTKRRRAWAISNALERVGGDLNAFTNKEDTVFHAAILKEHTPQAIDLLTDMVFHSVYPKNELDKEIDVICDEIESYNDSPADLIYDEFENILFGEHPLGHNILGSLLTVKSFNSDCARKFTAKYYRPENSIFFISGDINFQHVVKLLEQATSDFPIAKPIIHPTVQKPLQHYSPRGIEQERGTHQAHVMLGHRSYSIHQEERMSLYLLNNILGGPGMTSRLNQSLREKHGLVYTIESTMVNYDDAGLWAIYFGCDHEDLCKCMRLAKRELQKMIDKPLTERQLAAAKRQLKGQIGIACDNKENFALDFGKSYLHYGWERDITSLYRHIDAVTPESIQTIAEEIMQERQLTTLIYK